MEQYTNEDWDNLIEKVNLCENIESADVAVLCDWLSEVVNDTNSYGWTKFMDGEWNGKKYKWKKLVSEFCYKYQEQWLITIVNKRYENNSMISSFLSVDSRDEVLKKLYSERIKSLPFTKNDPNANEYFWNFIENIDFRLHQFYLKPIDDLSIYFSFCMRHSYFKKNKITYNTVEFQEYFLEELEEESNLDWLIAYVSVCSEKRQCFFRLREFEKTDEKIAIALNQIYPEEENVTRSKIAKLIERFKGRRNSLETIYNNLSESCKKTIYDEIRKCENNNDLYQKTISYEIEHTIKSLSFIAYSLDEKIPCINPYKEKLKEICGRNILNF